MPNWSHQKIKEGPLNAAYRTASLGGRQDAHFLSLIGEVRFSNGARYDKDFTPGNCFESADALALYHFDEGDVLKDSSGNRHHDKIVAPSG